jgi:hypothetical protein
MSDAMMQRLEAKKFVHHAEHLAVAGGHTAPLNAFPKIEAFLNTHFAQTCK